MNRKMPLFKQTLWSFTYKLTIYKLQWVGQQKCPKQSKNNFDRLPWLSVNCWKGGCIQELETHTHKQFQFLFSRETRGQTGLALLCACMCVFGRAKHMQIIYIWFLGGIVRIRVKAEPRTSVLGCQVSGEMNNKSALNKTGQPVAKGNKVETSNKDTWWLVPWLCVLGHNKGLV